jgi:HD-GYP domain-containing protein (c-di-GMP phosphodiesterase class II)
MLKRVPTDQLRVGMFLHELCGSWMDHPFWRSKFLLEDPGDLERIQQCGIKEAWIDTARGMDVEGGRTQQEVEAEVELELELAAMAPLAPVPHEREFRHAAQLRDKAREQIKSLFGEARMGRAIQTDGCGPLVEDIVGSIGRNRGALISLIRLKTQDEYTYLHSVAVCTLMVALGRTLGLSDAAVHEAGLAGLRHDMGKARIPLEVLNKPGRLTDAEFAMIKKHPEWGHAMLKSAPGVPAVALDVCWNHHEKLDGSGYPRGLKDPQISLVAKMGAVCDVYDAVTSVRAYKSAWDPGEAVRQMAQWKGHFDQRVFQAFVKTVGIYPVGTLVKLQSGRLGVVLEQNDQSLLMPRVKVFFSAKHQQHITPEVVDLAASGCQDKVTGVESAEQWGFKDLDRYWLDEVGLAG